MTCEYSGYGRSVANVDTLEAVPGMADNVGERVKVARIRQLVDVDDGFLRIRDQPANDRGADEPSSSRDQDRHIDFWLNAAPSREAGPMRGIQQKARGRHDWLTERDFARVPAPMHARARQVLSTKFIAARRDARR